MHRDPQQIRYFYKSMSHSWTSLRLASSKSPREVFISDLNHELLDRSLQGGFSRLYKKELFNNIWDVCSRCTLCLPIGLSTLAMLKLRWKRIGALQYLSILWIKLYSFGRILEGQASVFTSEMSNWSVAVVEWIGGIKINCSRVACHGLCIVLFCISQKLWLNINSSRQVIGW